MKVRMLEIDLSSGKLEKKELDDSYFRNWIGGRGLGAKLLSEEKIAANTNTMPPLLSSL